jgi:hypothetical protein
MKGFMNPLAFALCQLVLFCKRSKSFLGIHLDRKDGRRPLQDSTAWSGFNHQGRAFGDMHSLSELLGNRNLPLFA